MHGALGGIIAGVFVGLLVRYISKYIWVITAGITLAELALYRCPPSLKAAGVGQRC